MEASNCPLLRLFGRIAVSQMHSNKASTLNGLLQGWSGWPGMLLIEIPVGSHNSGLRECVGQGNDVSKEFGHSPHFSGISGVLLGWQTLRVLCKRFERIEV